MPRHARPGLPPVRKSLGQHFLSDRRILAHIVDALAPTGSDTVVEIGPGRGAMTDILRDRSGHVVAVEYDRALAALLRERYAGDERVRIVQADVLETPLGDVAGADYLLVGNVPYNITTPILFHALTRPRARRAVFLVQLEVARRMTAPPGSRAYGALSVNLQSVATVEMLFRVPAGAFTPPPRVESAVVRLEPRADPTVSAVEEAPFREFVQALFGMRRKQMRTILRAVWSPSTADVESILSDVGVPAEARPETLTSAQLAAIFRATRRAS